MESDRMPTEKVKAAATKVIVAMLITSVIALSVYYCYPEEKLPENITIDSIVVHKSQRKLMAFSQGKLLKIYTISLGRNPVGAKEFEGDKKTPEGIYHIYDKNPNSSYHKNLGISYPDTLHIENARKYGRPAGGDVKIHGFRNGLGFIGKFHRWFDWTAGCIAMTDEEVDELYYAVKIGAVIEIKP